MKFVMLAGILLSSGCGLYVSHGGGEYAFIGPGSDSIARRCDPVSAQKTSKWRYDYAKGGNLK